MKIKPEALLFDMDGTLTDARQSITTDVVDTLRFTAASVEGSRTTRSAVATAEAGLSAGNTEAEAGPMPSGI